ncbi:hypothetical protein MSHO_24160 [Mycobacterium shottsii]|uniref:Uncharacterized protein n=1 Tax=Mycobacterium shottsii TaxID=133549 RepID=A0A7I7LAK4_9MYCO|nr:hypothetical protein MSHO_24160 [Mycobacterium shottsii]
MPYTSVSMKNVKPTAARTTSREESVIVAVTGSIRPIWWHHPELRDCCPRPSGPESVGHPTRGRGEAAFEPTRSL